MEKIATEQGSRSHPQYMEKSTSHQRILVIGDRFPDSFADNIAVTLEDMGYQVRCLPVNPLTDTNRPLIRNLCAYLTRFSFRVEDFLAARLIEAAREFQPHLVLATTGEVPPKVIAALKGEGAATAVWYTDPVANLGRQYLLAAPYDYLFFKEPHMVSLFRDKLEKNTYYLPEACNPRWHRPVELGEAERAHFGCDLSLTGNMYYYRALVMEHFLDYRVKIWGPSFPRWLDSSTRAVFMRQYVVREEKAKAFRAAAININSLTPAEINGVNWRTFEVAGCGGFQIAEFRPELANLFEIDREIVTFNTLGELKEKVAYYLVHEEERQEIALKSQRRAHRDHTYELRLRSLLKTVEDGSRDRRPSL